MTKKYFKISLFIVFLLIVSGIYVSIYPKNNNKESGQANGPSSGTNISPDILYLSDPIYAFRGKIEKIEANTLFISHEAFVQQPAVETPTGPAPAPKSKTLLYKVTVNANTPVVTLPSNIPYLYKSTVPTQNKTPVTVKDLKAGQSVSAISATDLRTLQTDTFEARSIELSSSVQPVIGSVTGISGNTITILGQIINPQAAPSQQAKQEQYTIVVSSDTEISKPAFIATSQNGDSATSSPSKKLSLYDLKAGMIVSVYADKEILPKQENTALLVQQMSDKIVVPAPSAVVSSPSAVPVKQSPVKPTSP